MRNPITCPPYYFFGSMILCVISPWVMPQAKLIPFPLNLMGIIPLILGYYLLHRASRIFYRLNTTFHLEKPSAFAIEGYFKWSRNPMYLGAFIFLMGLAMLMGNAMGFVSPVLFFLAMNYVCIPPEERIMEATFGQDYLDYKSRVRRWI